MISNERLEYLAAMARSVAAKVVERTAEACETDGIAESCEEDALFREEMSRIAEEIRRGG